MPQSDPQATASDLLGRVVRICRGKSSFAPSRKMPMLHSTLAWMLCHCKRIRSLALLVHAARLRSGAAPTASFAHGESGMARGMASLSGSRASHV